MTSLGKVLAVLTAVASVLFVTGALVILTSGPNWLGKANQVEGYSFTRSAGEEPQWTAVNDETGESVKTDAQLADVIPAALDQKVKVLAERTTALEQRKAALQQRLEISKQTAAADAQLLDQRIGELRRRIAAVRDQTAATAREVAAAQEQIGAVEGQVVDRRGDVFRLQATLERAELDGLRAQRLERQLSDLLVQLEADLAAARQRRDQMRDGAGGGPSLTNTEQPNAGSRTAGLATGESK